MKHQDSSYVDATKLGLPRHNMDIVLSVIVIYCKFYTALTVCMVRPG